MKISTLIIPFVSSTVVASIFFNVSIFRDVVVFAYLSFVPGFAILKLLKLKDLSILNTFLISVGLSLVASMFVGLLVNELFVSLGFSQPLSIIPLTTAMLLFTFASYFIGFRSEFSINPASLAQIPKRASDCFPLVIVLVILSVISIIGALYIDIPIMIFSCVTIAVLSLLSVVSNKMVPEKIYPFLIFSIAISLVFLNLFISKYTIGDDANLEYYVFRITQVNGFWGPISTALNPSNALRFNSMLSITLLPNMYSIMMNLKNEILFKILYGFVACLIPVTLYGIYKNEVGKLVGLLSALFFIFSINGFFGELLSVDRQIIAEFFLVLSIFLWLDKAFPIREKRILLVIFGIGIAISHYSLAVIYIIFLSFIILISSIKPKFDNVFNASTVLAIFGGSFLWLAFGPGSTLSQIISSVQSALAELTSFHTPAAATVSDVYAIPKTFTVASWYNLAITGVVTLLLVIGIPIVVLFSRRLPISDKYRAVTLFSGILLAAAYLLPSVAATVNFTRLYGISLLFLAPCLAIAILVLLKIMQNVLKTIYKDKKNFTGLLSKHGKTALLLIVILLGAYFFSQSGLVNYVTKGGIKGTIFDYYRTKASNNPTIYAQYYSDYIQMQDAYSATWLSKYDKSSSIVYSDTISYEHVLTSDGLIPENLIFTLTNNTTPQQGNYVYLDSLNVAKDTVPTLTGSLNSSEVPFSGVDSIYSNGNSEIGFIAGPG